MQNELAKPNRPAIEKLVAALRSREFSQGRGALADKQGNYCCLGVACELFRRDTGEGRWTDSSGSVKDYEVGEYEGDGVLPRPVQEYYGFSLDDPRLITVIAEETDHYENVCAASLNDEGKTFAEIADLFEAYYLKSTQESK